jgi:hypothetical protein
MGGGMKSNLDWNSEVTYLVGKYGKKVKPEYQPNQRRKLSDKEIYGDAPIS